MNKVMLIGNVGKEPVVHYYDADQAVAQVSFATTEKRASLILHKTNGHLIDRIYLRHI